MQTSYRLFQAAGRRRSAGVLFGLLVGLCFSGPVAAIKVAFLAPGQPGVSHHWDRTIDVMRAAAADLDIDLQIAYSKTNTYTNRKEGLALLTAPEKPDFFVSGYWSGATDVLLKRAETLGVRTFIVGSAVLPGDRDVVGEPRGKYRQWIGQMTPDEHSAGYDLAERLIGAARQRSGNGAIHVVALGGFGDTSADLFRMDGLKAYLQTDANAVLDEVLLAEWSRETAYKSMKDMFAADDSSVSVVWSASDSMALGAVRAARETGIGPGDDIFIGGFDWTGEALEAVSAGDMEATLGGHFLEGAWTLVLLHDYYHDKDFADDLGTQFQVPLRALTADDAESYLAVINEADWSSVDFKPLSKVHNPELQTYQWPLEQLLEQLRQSKADS